MNKTTKQTELTRANALEEMGEHADAAQVRAMAETDFPTKDIQGSYRTPDGKAQIDFGITHRNGFPEFTASGHYDGSGGQCIDTIEEAYPDIYEVRQLATLHDIFHLREIGGESANAVRNLATMHPSRSFHEDNAQAFLVHHGLRLRITLSNTKPANWEPSGDHYRVTLSRAPMPVSDERMCSATGSSRLVFDFWGSLNDASTGEAPSAYDVLACISGDAYTLETFEDFCAEYGDDEDSIKSLQLFNRCSRFAKRLRAFFTESELEALQEIR